MDSEEEKSKHPILLWTLVGLLGLGGVGLFVFGLMQPEPRRNLADPVAMANLAPKRRPKFASEPSEARRIAKRKDEKKMEECEWRHQDCGYACAHYARKSPSRKECMGFCARARSSCESWANN